MPIKKIIITLVFASFSLLTSAQKCCQFPVEKDTINFFIENLETSDIEYFIIPKRKIREVSVTRKNEDVIVEHTNETLQIYLRKRYFEQLKFKDVLTVQILNAENLFYVNNVFTTKELFAELYLKNYSSIEFSRTSSDIFEIKLTAK